MTVGVLVDSNTLSCFNLMLNGSLIGFVYELFLWEITNLCKTTNFVSVPFTGLLKIVMGPPRVFICRPSQPED